MNLHVVNNSTNFFETRAISKLSYNTITASGNRIRPEVSLSYGYDWAGNRQRTNSNFIGQQTSFVSTSSKVVQGAWKLATGVNIYRKDSITLNGVYEHEYRKDYSANSVSAKVRYDF